MTDSADEIVPEIRTESGITVVQFGEDADSLYEHQIAGFKNQVLEQAQTAEPPQLLVSLPHTKYFGSAFLAFLLTVRKAVVSREGGRFGLVGLTPYCRTIVEMSQLDEVWDMFDSMAQAAEAYGTT